METGGGGYTPLSRTHAAGVGQAVDKLVRPETNSIELRSGFEPGTFSTGVECNNHYTTGPAQWMFNNNLTNITK